MNLPRWIGWIICTLKREHKRGVRISSGTPTNDPADNGRKIHVPALRCDLDAQGQAETIPRRGRAGAEGVSKAEWRNMLAGMPCVVGIRHDGCSGPVELHHVAEGSGRERDRECRSAIHNLPNDRKEHTNEPRRL